MTIGTTSIEDLMVDLGLDPDAEVPCEIPFDTPIHRPGHRADLIARKWCSRCTCVRTAAMCWTWWDYLGPEDGLLVACHCGGADWRDDVFRIIEVLHGRAA